MTFRTNSLIAESTEDRLRELSNFYTECISDQKKIINLLFFIAKELVFINTNRKRDV